MSLGSGVALSKVEWSPIGDQRGGKARTAIEGSEHREPFMRQLARFAAKANRHERVRVDWWHFPYLYVTVIDLRMHHPCGLRCLASFDLTNGEWASARSERLYRFARHGWSRFLTELTHFNVPIYNVCADPFRAEGCALRQDGWEDRRHDQG